MTIADRLRQQAAEQLRQADRQAAALLEIAAVLDGLAPSPSPGRERYFLDTAGAMKIARRSSSWLYANGRRFGFGWRLQSGAWAFSESQLRAFMAGRASECEKSELCEKSDAPPLSASPRVGHGPEN